MKKTFLFTMAIFMLGVNLFAQEPTVAVGLGLEFNMNAREKFAGGAVDWCYSRVLYCRDRHDWQRKGRFACCGACFGQCREVVRLNYTVANISNYNLIDFGGVSVSIAPVTEAGNGTRTYTINPADASGDNKIIIIATFTHTNLTPDPIVFKDTTPRIVKTYGDAVFTNEITKIHKGSGTISYSSENEAIATVNSSGVVTMHKAGTTVISARKAADTVYAAASHSYTLTVEPKPVTISGLGAANKVYDATTTATVTGTAQIVGLEGEDKVTVNVGTATFADKNVGNGKTVSFSGFSLGSTDAGNYTVSQPANTTANITQYSLTGNINISPIKLTPIEGELAASITFNVNRPVAETESVTATITLTSSLPSGLSYNAGTRTFTYNSKEPGSGKR